MDQKFNIGDRVICTYNYMRRKNDADNIVGEIGTVTCFEYYGHTIRYGISFDNCINGGHSCGGECALGHGWYIPAKHLEYADDEIADDVNEADYLDILIGSERT